MSTHPSRRSFLSTGIVGGVVACAAPACAQRRPRPFDAEEFGAVGDGIANDAPAFQRAIDAASAQGGGTVRFGRGVFSLKLRPAQDGVGVEGITLRSNVTLEGENPAGSVLRLADSQLGEGTYVRIISSSGALERAAVRDFTLDGNRSGQGRFRDAANGGAVVLGRGGRCVDVAAERLSVNDANGQGIMLLGAVRTPGRAMRVADCLVQRASYIGIQSSQFDGLTIERNRVFDCGDNGIDIYGNDDIGQSVVSTSRNGMLRDNEVRRCRVGIFLETVAGCRAVNNVLDASREAGVRINRINGEPKDLQVVDNRITGGVAGVIVSGDTGGVEIRNNIIVGFTKVGVRFTYNVSRVTVAANSFVPAHPTVPIIVGEPADPNHDPADQLSFVTIRNNHVPRDYRGELFVNRYVRHVEVMSTDFHPDLR